MYKVSSNYLDCSMTYALDKKIPSFHIKGHNSVKGGKCEQSSKEQIKFQCIIILALGVMLQKKKFQFFLCKGTKLF